MAILLSIGALVLGVIITGGALMTDNPSVFPLVLGAALWALGLTGVIVFAIYGRVLHDTPRGQWLRSWRTATRRRRRPNGHTPHGSQPIPQA